MVEEEIRMRVRALIISMKKPFCVVNLLIRLEKEGITDQRLILSVLNELYDEGVIIYTEVDGVVDDPNAPKWAFMVA